MGLLIWGTVSDERTGLSFTIAAGPRQRSQCRVRVPWDSRPYFTVSDLRLPFLSPPTTRRGTVEVFDPASTRCGTLLYNHFARTTQKIQPIWLRRRIFLILWLEMDVPLLRALSPAGMCLPSHCLAVSPTFKD
jgi:hypothetical protein